MESPSPLHYQHQNRPRHGATLPRGGGSLASGPRRRTKIKVRHHHHCVPASKGSRVGVCSAVPIRLSPYPACLHPRFLAPVCSEQPLTPLVAHRTPTSRHLWSTPHSEYTLRERRYFAIQRARRELYLRLRPHRGREMWCIPQRKGFVQSLSHLPPAANSTQQPTLRASSA
jgi:hypothetical protein